MSSPLVAEPGTSAAGSTAWTDPAANVTEWHIATHVGPPHRRRKLPASWPLFAALVLFPVWWIVGLGSFVFPIFAIPMATQLARRAVVKTPPWFGLWALFVGWSLLSGLMLNLTAPDTLPQSFGQAIDSFVLRSLQYLAATVVLLYVSNLTESELPRLRVIRWLGLLFIITLAGGYLGLAIPTLEWKSPVELLLPGPLSARRGLVSMVHPQVAQIQDVIGSANARPNAPFEFTNAWGNNLSILLMWFVVGFLIYATRKRRWWGAIAVLAAVVPVIYSLNRGLWVGLVLGLVYVVVRLAIAGRPWLLGALAAAGVVGLLLIAVTPLGNVVQDRAAAGHSDQVRTSLAQQAVTGALASPILGYGGTRETVGSDESIAIGSTQDCPRCGNRTIGSTGHIWNVMFSQGLVGLVFFLGFFIATALHYRKDLTPIGLAGQTIVVVQLFYMTAYVGISSTLSLLMISIGLLWRNELAHQEGLA
ncbi:MAG TPA: O-antigen ligase domain-containing protein, partial [Actinomycetes bacterium]|nr:O-antigen ligase domain-containing protein [Actinomycetes bacterium]